MKTKTVKKMVLLEVSAIQIVLNVLNPIALIIFLILGLIKLRDSRKGNLYNIYLSSFFMLLFLGFLINILYVVFTDKISDNLYIQLARLVTFIIFYAYCFPLFFLISLKRGFITISKKFKLRYFLAWAAPIVIVLFIGDVSLGPERKVLWDKQIGIGMLVILGAEYLFFLKESIYLVQKFQDKHLKRKFLFFILGYSVLIIVSVSLTLFNSGWMESSTYTIISAICIIPGGYSMYYGVGKKIMKEGQ